MRGLIVMAVVFLTAHKMFYWPAYHSYFARLGDSHNRGTELSWMSVLRYGVGVAGPVVGGIIATNFGFPVLFLVTAGTIFLSAWPLLRTRERYSVRSFEYAQPWRVIFSRKYRNMSYAMLRMGENLIDLVYWPIFMVIALGTAERVGIITSLSTAVMALFGFIVGEAADRYSGRKVLRAFLPITILGYMFRSFAGVARFVLPIDVFNKVGFAGVNLAMTYQLYVSAKRPGYLAYATAFELVLSIAKATTAIALMAVFIFLPANVAFPVVFLSAGVLSLFYYFL